MNSTYFAIDPSIRACGWAFFNSYFMTAGLCQSKKKDPARAIIEIYNQLDDICPADIHYLIVERPVIQENWTQTKTKALEKLLACYGACLTLADRETVLWTPSVPEWKGQLSKEISHDRTKKILTKNDIGIKLIGNIPKSLEHNTLDAVALLTRYLMKEGVIK